MLRLISIILLLGELCFAQMIIVNPRRALVINPPASGPSSTGYELPTRSENLSEAPYNNADGAWQNVANIYGAGSASITTNNWDSGELSHILNAYTFTAVLPS